MRPYEMIAQIIGIIAMAFNILSYQQKKQKLLWKDPKRSKTKGPGVPGRQGRGN